MRTQQGPFPMETTYTWAAAGPEATRMTLRNRGEPAGSPRLRRRSWPRPCGAPTRKDLARLKRLLEAP